MRSDLRFNNDYEELVLLKSGGQIRLRLIRSNDKKYITSAFNQLSSESRYKRFLGSKIALTPEELRYFTEIDQYDHFALGALNLDPSKNETNLAGIMRFVRLISDPECAEVGVTVIDHSQKKGIGRLLLERIASAATERGIVRLRIECLSENMDIQRLVKKLQKDVKFIRENNLLVAQIEIPKQVTNSNQYPLNFVNDLSSLMFAFSSEAFVHYTDLSLKMFKKGLNRVSIYSQTYNKNLSSESRTNKLE